MAAPINCWKSEKQKFKVLKEMADAYSFVKGGKLKLKGHKDKKWV